MINQLKNIVGKLSDNFKESLPNLEYSVVNSYIEGICGVIDFFSSQNEYTDLIELKFNFEKLDKCEYGDFQTSDALSLSICGYLEKEENLNPELVIEPTCGKGAFIVSALKRFKNIKKIIGVEINNEYILISKIRILNYFLDNPERQVPKIEFYNCSIFDFNYNSHINSELYENILLLGNPPWVTNTELSGVFSLNIPNKANIKKLKGIDAITGKSNFDIAETILLNVLKQLNGTKVNIAFIVKNIVVKNIVFSQVQNKFQLSNIKSLKINAKKEFLASVEASVFIAKLNDGYGDFCSEIDFYTLAPQRNFGWFNNLFVSNIDEYYLAKDIDGISQLAWRQGIKHDCSSVMELYKHGELYFNKNSDLVDIEDDLVYDLLKSSDLNKEIIYETQRAVIVTQKFVGQSTDYIAQFPKTYKYLADHLDLFDNRKSSIYRNKPAFSIFGVGDYSFKKYKIGISGFYKRTNFTLILPTALKTIQLDDTCYFLGFDDLKSAVIALVLLNNKITQYFLNSIIFFDNKRPITKEILMRIDFIKLFKVVDKKEILDNCNQILNNIKSESQLSINDINNFEFELSQNINSQIELFRA